MEEYSITTIANWNEDVMSIAPQLERTLKIFEDLGVFNFDDLRVLNLKDLVVFNFDDLRVLNFRDLVVFNFDNLRIFLFNDW